MLALLALLVAADPVVPTTPGAPEPGGASDGLRILVVAPGADGARVEELYAGLRAAGLQPVELDERAGVDREISATTARPGVRDDARAHLQEAKARFRDLDIDGTRSALEAAVDEILLLERPEDALDTLVDALLLRASIALQAGLEDEARGALVLLARLEPARAELHPGLYAPSLVEAYAAARADEQARPEGALVVRPRVAGFAAPELLVDGQPAAPGAPLPLRFGPHLVTVRARPESGPAASGTTGAERSGVTLPFSQIVDVGPAPVEIEPFLAPADAAERRAALVEQARAAPDAKQRAEALAALAPLCAARAVLFVDDKAAALWVPGKPLEALRVKPSADGALLGRATLATLQAPVRRDPVVGPIAPVEEPLDALTIAGLSAAGIAVVVVGVIVGIYTLTPAADVPPGARPLDGGCCVP